MRHYIYIFFFVAFAGCNNPKESNNIVQENKSTHIKVCKVYSSDFVLLDPNDKGQLIQEFRFNKNGYVNELIRFNMEGEVIGKFDIFGEHTLFPMQGKPEFVDTVLTVLNLDSLEQIIGKEVKYYNNDGLLIEVKYFEDENKLVRKNTYTYDMQGMIKEDIYWDIELNKPKQKIKYEFEYFTK